MAFYNRSEIPEILNLYRKWFILAYKFEGTSLLAIALVIWVFGSDCSAAGNLAKEKENAEHINVPLLLLTVYEMNLKYIIFLKDFFLNMGINVSYSIMAGQNGIVTREK